MCQIKFYLLALVIFLAASPVSAQNSARIYSINPSAAQAGATAFPIVLTGKNFAKNSVVQVNGTNLETVALAWNKLRAVVPASLVQNAANLEVKIIHKSRVSNSVNLTIQNAPVGNYNFAAVTAKLQTFISTATPLPPNGVRGLTFMMARHGKIIYSQSFGNQTVDSVLPIASATKMPSGLTIMTLVDEGRLNLDAPISQYLQGYVTVPADKANITVRQLFNHISGLPPNDCLDTQSSTTLRQCTQAILNSPLDFTPGTRFAYGGTSMQVAGGVVEAITGESWNAYFARKVAQPLGLTRFTYGVGPNPRIAGGASSDVGDYTKIMQMYLASGVAGSTRVLSVKNYLEMQTDVKRDLPINNSPGGSTLTGYSFGWWHTSPQFLAQQTAPQTPGLELSDQGAFGCTPWIDLEHNYTAIILIQKQTSTGTAIWNEIRPLIIEQMRANN